MIEISLYIIFKTLSYAKTEKKERFFIGEKKGIESQTNRQTNRMHIKKGGGYYGIPFTFIKITILVFNKISQNHDEYIV